MIKTFLKLSVLILGVHCCIDKNLNIASVSVAYHWRWPPCWKRSVLGNWKQAISCAWALGKSWQANMDGNKDEALKCRELAEKYLREGKKEKALKFLEKSQKLYPSKEVEGKWKYCVVYKSALFTVNAFGLTILPLIKIVCRNRPNEILSLQVRLQFDRVKSYCMSYRLP